jgi:hypothetical protein
MVWYEAKHMNRASLSRALFLGLVVLQAGCAACPIGEVHHPALTNAEVVELANAEMRKAGVDLQGFHAPEVEFELGEFDCSWTVHYIHRSEVIGSHVGAVVHDRTKKVEVHGGM